MKQYFLSDFEANNDGVFDNTEAFAAAFTAIAEGGCLSIGPGTWRTGPITISGHDIEVHIHKDAKIVFIPEEGKYIPVYSRWEGINCYCMHPCLYILNSHRVTIQGEGTLYGSGHYWWDLSLGKRNLKMEPATETEKRFALLNPGYKSQGGGGGGRQSQFLRPPLVQVKDSSDILLEGITLEDSPFWTLHPLYSRNLVFKNLSIKNPKNAPNTDGIDLDSCENVTIEGCVIDVGDDGIALKSGSGPDGILTGRPTKDVRIFQCTVRNAHGGAVIGSETAAGIHNVEVSNCLFDGTDRGIRIKTRRGRGGKISHLSFLGLKMVKNLCPLTINLYYRCGSFSNEDFSLEKLPVCPETPSVSDIRITDCEAVGCLSSIAFIVGLPESPITGLCIEDCTFSLDQEESHPVEESEMYLGLPLPQGRGMRLRNVHLMLKNVSVNGVMNPFEIEENVRLENS
ncbi:endopolygalacturonase [Sphaerochaeta pleomorpha str. Grapes]|uniref:Endopolygalacturonase n=1 Tax=Sphaerochaeta pleomorpha (strain ATCC BAA-1885 / DSM 22778 / Grapes) TaxID=158190 RepID=G8QQA1_SPHPG|nr:glycoside hydrolase family 28 protein [Sphaerochaeta pleomorpha]AEV29746.1 endopolygalacturonase [Sphaerochaeta pleomorpha str. Grapes]